MSSKTVALLQQGMRAATAYGTACRAADATLLAVITGTAGDSWGASLLVCRFCSGLAAVFGPRCACGKRWKRRTWRCTDCRRYSQVIVRDRRFAARALKWVKLLVGTILGNRYEIEAKLGEGGIAVVYRANDLLLAATVAVKVLSAICCRSLIFVFDLSVRQAAASLSHPNVVSIFDVGSDAGTHFIVRDGIHRRAKPEGDSPQARTVAGPTALHIAQQVCKALDAAHRRGLVHRDVGPYNILVTDECHIKLPISASPERRPLQR